jgi:ABC-type Co2+ transport system permease subunit
MVNFPLFPLPISGHLLGGVLSAVLLGPSAGAVVIGAVLIVQCFLFGDGWMTLVHAGIGLGEALITGAVLRFLLAMRPDLFKQAGHADRSIVRP